jgi:hypothetical protein
MMSLDLVASITEQLKIVGLGWATFSLGDDMIHGHHDFLATPETIQIEMRGQKTTTFQPEIAALKTTTGTFLRASNQRHSLIVHPHQIALFLEVEPDMRRADLGQDDL